MNLKMKFLAFIISSISMPLLVEFLINALKLQVSFELAWLFASIIVYGIIGYSTYNKQIKPINTIIKILEEMKDGNFSNKIDVTDNNDEISNISFKINEVIDTVKYLINNLEKDVKKVYSSGENLRNIAQSSSKIAEEVASTVEQLATGATSQVNDIHTCTNNVSNITDTSNNISEQVENISGIANNFVKIALVSKDNVESTLIKVNEIKLSSSNVAEQIQALGQLGKEIGEIVDLITSLAHQTNLLALNASIEAARAGEEGKGFAVVAGEVKKLALRSSESANQIKEMISKIQNESERAVESTNESLIKVEEGASSFAVIKENFEQIFEQAKIIDKESNLINREIIELVDKSKVVLSAMNSVSTVTETNAASAEEIAASTEEHSAGVQELDKDAKNLIVMSRNLSVSSSIFKTDEEPVIFFWNRKLFTGVSEVDYEHFQIVNSINKLYKNYLYKANLREFNETLNELYEITKVHFAHEQLLMKKYEYPRLPQQINEHTKLLADLSIYITAIKNNTTIVNESFLSFLKEWLLHHILEEDMLYAPFFKSKGVY